MKSLTAAEKTASAASSWGTDAEKSTVGEETGALAEMLTRIANTYDDEVDNAVAGMTAAIEPALIIVLAVVVGTIVVAMFLPMIKIISSVSGGAA